MMTLQNRIDLVDFSMKGRCLLLHNPWTVFRDLRDDSIYKSTLNILTNPMKHY